MMRRSILFRSTIGFTVALLVSGIALIDFSLAQVPITPLAKTASLEIRGTEVEYLPDLDLLVFEQSLDGLAGQTVPAAAGQLDGAPVLGYVFPTNLQPEDVGFGPVDGVVAMAVTSHPDFDDTPLWDEDNNRTYDDDGAIFHSHWVVLEPDERVPGGLSVKQFQEGDRSVIMPPTNPGMSMYLDSPGFPVLLQGHRLKVLVPASRVSGKTSFNYDAVTAYMRVNASDESRPLLGVYELYDVFSGDLSLPFSVQSASPNLPVRGLF